MKKRTLYYIALILGLSIILIVTLFRPQASRYEGFRAHRMVAHAMGGIEGLTYSNSFEAFEANYAKGTRVFEADLLLSKDDELIARHEWGESFTKMMGQEKVMDPGTHAAVWTFEEFKNAKIMGKYEPLSWDDILDLMEQHPDMYLVTDTKQIEPEEIDRIFTKIVESAKQKDPALLERIVPQIYYQSMWDAIEDIYPFESVIFTLYQTHDSDDEVVRFAKEKGLAAITMSETRANENLVSALNKIGVPSYVHTINDPKTILKFKRMGVYGFYTDFLEEDDAGRVGWLEYLGL
ncbi:glycerophosphodiester phosphodiesterase [Paenibacillus sp. Marseille-P2973]|uniref:phosphatidylinositol-specific phospholipase C/glycerophosphodiester phosphodiesterase family protein n=1 Tax=Paenibacillus sp. Marseille-P2973 TaxID=1871032 RepID=UPI001B39AC21|nr:phosphatidylinositol-specific phospholipase C/glycerophosphodiester phosphodiesterase family protein [Paenibacillus sp. Marseille-P2973]MBQ4899941.1 glycerophosphodiester phosphodiesterase [Paenibacillus sp. Marseille-P2973]